jgi:hypothetical protein
MTIQRLEYLGIVVDDLAAATAFFGLQERRDSRHQAARAHVARGMGRLVTANHVVGEMWRLIRRSEATQE